MTEVFIAADPLCAAPASWAFYFYTDSELVVNYLKMRFGMVVFSEATGSLTGEKYIKMDIMKDYLWGLEFRDTETKRHSGVIDHKHRKELEDFCNGVGIEIIHVKPPESEDSFNSTDWVVVVEQTLSSRQKESPPA